MRSLNWITAKYLMTANHEIFCWDPIKWSNKSGSTHSLGFVFIRWCKISSSIIIVSKIFHITVWWHHSKHPLWCHNRYVMLSGQLHNVTMGGWHCHWYQTIMWPTAWIFHTRSRKTWIFYAPFTPTGDCRATGRDSANRHWSLVVATSPLLVATVRHTVSKHHGNEKTIFISATKWTVTQLLRIDETQLRQSRDGVTWQIYKNKLRQHGVTLRLYIIYVSTISQQWGDKWRL